MAIVKTNAGTQTISGTNSFTGGLGVTGTGAGILNYGSGETNSSIFNYPVNIANPAGTLNFNIAGTYYVNDATTSGNGTLGLNNVNMVLWLNQNYVNFAGNVVVNAGTAHLVGTYAGGALTAGGISTPGGTNATAIIDASGDNIPEVGGSANFGANSTVVLTYDTTGGSFKVDGGLAANSYLSVNVVGSPLGK